MLKLNNILLLAGVILFVSCEDKQIATFPTEPRNIKAMLSADALQTVLLLRQWENNPGLTGKWEITKNTKTGEQNIAYFLSQSELECLKIYSGGYEVIPSK